jgi:hypothetical protein
VREGSSRTPTLCESEPTLLLVVIVGGLMLAAIAFATALIVTRRRPSGPTARPAPVAPSAPAQPQEPTASERRQSDRSWRDVYARLLAFVDRAMADVARMMPDDTSMPAMPLRIENEESGRLAAEITVLGSSDVHAAHTAWTQALFRFYLLARDVAEAWSQNLPEEQYREDVIELRRTRANVIAMADALRRQVNRELGG